MTLTLYLHPLASFCHKVLIAIYENDTPFVPHIVDFGSEDATSRLLDLWPVGKIPVLQDAVRNRIVPETTVIIDYLDRHYPGPHPLLPTDETLRLEARLWDRFFDLHVHAHMQKIVADRLRADGERDPRGVADARASLALAYGMIERQMADKTWAIGADFSIADCAAAPALFYAGILEPFEHTHPHLSAYFERLLARPSFIRVIDEARPYFSMFPFHEAMPQRFLDGGNTLQSQQE